MSLRYIELAFRYRQLMGRCEAGMGLDFEEIEQVTDIEMAFSERGQELWPTTSHADMRGAQPVHDDPGQADTRPSIHIPDLCVELRSPLVHCTVELELMDLHTCICRDAPSLILGQSLELRVSAPGDNTSYRFMTRVEWTRQCANNRHVAGMGLVGVPIEIRHTQVGPSSGDITIESLAA